MAQVYKNLTEQIGNTSLVRLQKIEAAHGLKVLPLDNTLRIRGISIVR